ncbi:aldo/keto reductase [Actinacidiphila acidipaludis]|uniref:Aldo/keto reductase n=1 Tax=Actinacidiphila acidipaludis TaxID=2873382 RepID=A0ABS7Q389_9ACTN|nr:aldo/keto reductase [Streptomyces acidipaludis]MBY8877602.1 aldo/keto reductase [Streptomyces acidipaludis]
MARIGDSDLDVFPLALGGNVFGWTADEAQSFAVLDAYAAAGGDFLDTADVYSAWVDGNSGGESETIIGRWLARRGRRDDIVVATKAGSHPDFKGLRAGTIKKAAEASLRRLGTDHIDLYYSHFDDLDTPVEEIVTALDALVKEGKVRALGASNISAERLAASLDFAEREGLTRYEILQPHYNLVEREHYEGPLAALVAERGLSAAPYFGLAAGFLTGKYRPGGTAVGSAREGKAASYLAQERGPRVLAALDEVAAAHSAEPATVALAWLGAQPTVVAPIASARTVEQLPALVAAADLKLTPEEVAVLTAAA